MERALDRELVPASLNVQGCIRLLLGIGAEGLKAPLLAMDLLCCQRAELEVCGRVLVALERMRAEDRLP